MCQYDVVFSEDKYVIKAHNNRYGAKCLFKMFPTKLWNP